LENLITDKTFLITYYEIFPRFKNSFFNPLKSFYIVIAIMHTDILILSLYLSILLVWFQWWIFLIVKLLYNIECVSLLQGYTKILCSGHKISAIHDRVYTRRGLSSICCKEGSLAQPRVPSCSLKEVPDQVEGKLGLGMQLTHLHGRSWNS